MHGDMQTRTGADCATSRETWSVWYCWNGCRHTEKFVRMTRAKKRSSYHYGGLCLNKRNLLDLLDLLDLLNLLG